MAFPADRQQRLAATLLKPGPSTRVCTLMKGGTGSLETLAAQLGIEPDRRPETLREALARAADLLTRAEPLGLRVVTSVDAEYPTRLAEIADPPVALWVRGPAPLDSRAVALVGSRQATPAGLSVARDLATNLVKRDYTIVSGLAAGIDGAAHDAALVAGGTTIAVLGCGVDVVYPRHHARLAQAIASTGALVSELPPGTAPVAFHFPLRNRIISGLSLAVVVVEASEKSGSLITARAALDQGRDVLAVPGSVASGRYRGCHALIRDGARLVESVDDVLEELEGVAPRAATGDASRTRAAGPIESVMPRGETYSLDDLAARTGRTAADLLADLTQLELDGRVSRTPGGCFVRP